MKRTLLVRKVALVATLFSLPILAADAAILIASDSSGWNYRKGTAEASDPTSAWRAPGFDDNSWATGDTPLRYGDGNGGTVLDDMRDGYSTVFMRRTFNVSDVALISRLDLNVDYDDGFTVWINGAEGLSQNAPATPTFDAFAGANHESGSSEPFELTNPASFLVEGENTIAIQVFNVSLGSSDMMMNPELVSTAPDFDPPAVLAFDPPPGTVLNLTQLTVTFSEPVTGVDAVADLEINDTGAQSVSGSGDQYTFTFANVPLGQATVTWSQDHGIADTAVAPNAFDETVPGEVRIYNVVDNLPPSVTGIFPPAGVTLRSFGEVEISFSEPVAGVDAGDLLAGGVAASSVSGSGAGPYTFVFAGVGDGAVAMSWDAGHGIEDFAADPNAFVANSWSYSVDPDAAFGDLVINEIIASNRNGLLDEDGEASDWIELFNFGATAIELAGWSLSDDAEEPGKFVLPSRTLPAGGYLVIFATGKDRAPVAFGEIHTNFKLSGSGEYLGLFAPESPRSVADEISPAYPQQRNDHSYGRDSAGPWRYYSSPTPGAANGDSTIVGLLETPHTNVDRGFYDRPFNLHLTSPDGAATLQYTTDGSEPTSGNGQIYAGPITINSTTVFRAAAFQAGHLPSEITSHTYIYNASAAIRSLPVVSLTTDDSNLGPTGIQESNPRNCAQRGIAWERPVSAEVIDADDDSRNTQVNCGLRVQGGNYVRGRYSRNGGLPFSKYSFRLYFRGDYGPTMWDYPFFQGHAVTTYDRITLRAGMNDHSNPFIVDEMVRRQYYDTGQVSARGNFVNLFINGQHKGYYNPTERIDDDFMRSWHGGDEAWDVIAQFGEVREGDNNEWNSMRSIVGRDQSVPANFAASLDVLDVDNFIDYLLVNINGGTGDWPHNNWRAARERVDGAKFRFYVWDAEWSLGNHVRSVNVNTITGELGGGSEIATLFQSLTASPEFRLRFADRVHKHFYNGGALEDARSSEHYEGMRAEMSSVLPGIKTNIRTTWIPNRRGIIMQHMADADLQHSADAPAFAQFGGPVPEGFDLTMTAPNGGTIYYTLDGSDPREPLVDDGGGGSTQILAESAAKRVLVPSDGSLGTNWTGGNEPFDDSSWTAGTGGVGYDESATYVPLIDIDVDAAMNDINTSCYIRIPFTVSAGDLTDANFMQLKARYDDGFIAYLNGVRITDGNGPASPSWNSTSAGDNPDTSAVNLRSFNVSDAMAELVIGDNMLAIHGLNISLTSSDFLASFSMEVGENLAGDVADTAIEYTAAAPINGTTLVKSRTLRNGVWSAMTEAIFINGPAIPQIRITEIMYNPPAGSVEYIELQNFGPLPVDLGFVQLDGVNFTFPGETMIAPGEIIVLVSNDDPDRFAANWPGIAVFGYFGGSLSNGGERVALIDAFGNTLVSVDYSDSEGWPQDADGGGASLALLDPDGDPDDPANWISGGSPGNGTLIAVPTVLFNEVRAIGAAGEADFVELINFSILGPIDLGGYGLSDDPADPMRFTFPANTILPVAERIVVWCDSEAGLGFHSGFGLDREGESLFLTDPAGNRVDALSFGLQAPGYSLSRASIVFGSSWELTLATPGAENGDALAPAPQSQLSINEWLANPVPGGDDWLELYNRDTTNPVALQGLHISSGGATFRIGALSFLEPGGFIRLWADGGVGSDHLDLRLPAEGGTLASPTFGGQVIGSVNFGSQTEGVSGGRLPDGTASITTFPTSASPGASNYAAPSSPVVLNELLAGAGGWIELKNTGGTPLLLDGFGFAVDDRDSTPEPLPTGLSIPAGSRAQIDLATSQAGGAVFLFDAAGLEIDRVEFGAQPTGLSIGRPSDSGGFTLLSAPTPAAANSGASSFSSTTALRINEWLADADAGGDDYIELYNPGANPASLIGLRLTDDLSQGGIDQFAFPPLSYIAAGGFIALTADNSRLPGHLPFNLDADGETLRLHAATGTTIIDEITWGIETEGISSGRTTDGGGTIAQLAFQSPGASNELDPNADTDGDDIPDLWEIANGLNPNDPNDAALDIDGDTRSALFEYLSGTDPNDRASVLAFETLTLDLTGLTLQFTARAGIRYTVEFSDDLGDGNWSTIETVEPSANDHTETVFDIGGGTGRFYRISAERP